MIRNNFSKKQTRNCIVGAWEGRISKRGLLVVLKA
jgi:hypothetical protein